MTELQLSLILAFVVLSGGSVLLQSRYANISTSTRSRRAISECGSPASSLFEITEKISVNQNHSNDLGAIAALFHGDVHKCGATLIARNFLLTAAHCVVDFSGPIKISLGKANFAGTLNSNSQHSYTIKKYHKFSEYHKSGNKYDDIVLLETNDLVEYTDDIWPYCLPEKNIELNNNQAVRIAGWGLVNGGHTSSKLNQATIEIRDKDNCEDILKAYKQFNKYTQDYPYGVNNALLCAGGNGVDACSGDSGGPLFYRNPEGYLTIIGIIASGIGTCPLSAVVPGFYTKVEKYLDWIDKTTRDHSQPLQKYETTRPQPQPSYGVVGLWDAAKRGDLDYVNGAMSRNFDFNWKNPSHHKSTALHAAAEANNHQIVEVLLRNGVKKNIRDSRGMTPLYIASWLGGRDAANTLIQYSADVDTPGNNGSTPLMVATWKGRIDIVKDLLDAGAITYPSNANGETVLHNAAAYNRPAIARMLIQKGVNKEAIDKWGLTAEELAREQGYPEVARIIQNTVPMVNIVNRRKFQHAPPQG